MKVWFRGVPGPFLFTPLIRPFPYSLLERLGPGIATNIELRAIPPHHPPSRIFFRTPVLDARVVECVAHLAALLGLDALDAVDLMDEPIRLREIRDFDCVIAFRRGLVNIAGVGEFLGIGIRLPYHYALEAARIQLADWAVTVSSALAEGPIPNL